MCQHDGLVHVEREAPLVAEVFQRYGATYLSRHKVTRQQRLTISNIIRCRTPALGGHHRDCPHCHHSETYYNSCRDRSCPRCQFMNKAAWTAKQADRMLPVPHFFVTTTVPSQLGHIAQRNQRAVFDLMFHASTEALQDLASDTGLGRLGIIAVLHTWARAMTWHPHLHHIVTGGAWNGTTWTPTPKPDFLFPNDQLRALYRKHMLQGLHHLYDTGQLVLDRDLAPLADPVAFGALITTLWDTPFVLDIQPPRGLPEHAVKYLATYSRGIAISDHRMRSLHDDHVTFATRDDKTLTLHWEEFIRRFLLHVLPSGFKKVRYYGLYANSAGAKREQARQAIYATRPLGTSHEPQPQPQTPPLNAMSWQDRITLLTGIDPRVCPKCHRHGMIITDIPPDPLWRPYPSLQDTS
jgi:hypothetical protein